MGLDCGEEEILVGVVDDADDGLAVNGEAEGDAGVGERVDEICCSWVELVSLKLKMKGKKV